MNEFAKGTITWPALAAWGEQTGRRIAPWEGAALITLDLIRTKSGASNG